MKPRMWWENRRVTPKKVTTSYIAVYVMSSRKVRNYIPWWYIYSKDDITVEPAAHIPNNSISRYCKWRSTRRQRRLANSEASWRRNDWTVERVLSSRSFHKTTDEFSYIGIETDLHSAQDWRKYEIILTHKQHISCPNSLQKIFLPCHTTLHAQVKNIGASNTSSRKSNRRVRYSEQYI